MRTTYILDTSVLIEDPSAYKQFYHSDVVIPITVLNELDKLKKDFSDAAKKARLAIRLLDELSELTDISTGVLIKEQDVLVKIDPTYYNLENEEFAGFGDPSYGDTQILACAISNLRNHPTKDVIFVSNDINLRVKAKARGLDSISHEGAASSFSEMYSGVQVVVDEEAGLDLQKNNSIDPRAYNLKLNANECVLFKNENDDGIAMGRRMSPDKLKPIKKHYPWGISPRNKEQCFAIDLLMDKNVDLVTLIGKAGSGKSLVALACALELVLSKKEYDKLVIYRPVQAVGNDIGYLPGPQPLDAKILTPTGWTTMGELSVGSEVISRDGHKTKVLGVYPKGTKSVYKVTTTDGTSTECCEDHLWLTQTWENKKRQKPGSVKTTKQIFNTLKNKKGKFNHYLPRNEAIHFNEQELSIPPYLMGCILGDGSISDSVCISNVDQELIDRANKESQQLNCYLTNNGKDIIYNIRSKLYNNKPAQIVRTTNTITNEIKEYASIGEALKEIKIKRGALHHRCINQSTIDNVKYEFLPKPVRWQNPIKNHLHNLGLSDKKAWEKFIPDTYKYNSVENRVNLLRGLMDTDGTIKKNGEASFTTTSLSLANDMIELVRSLGGRATLTSRNRIGKKSILNEKRKIQTRRISYEFTISLPQDINPFYISRKASRHKCEYIHAVGISSIDYVGEKPVQCIMVENPEHLYITDNFIVTHNTMEEKLAPWFQAIMDSLEVLFSTKSGDWKRNLEMYQKKGQIEMDAITYIRGRSIPDSIILIDEAQNLSKDEIKTLLTRAGEGTKIILTGDIEQIDNNKLDAINNGLTYTIEKFKDSELAGHITFTQGERSRLATLAANIL